MVKFNKKSGQYEKIREDIIIDPKTRMLDIAADENGVGHLFLSGIGIGHNLEMSDYCVNKGDIVPYHCHKYGYELFVMISGSVNMIVGGKRTTAEPGDMILLRPHMPHAFEYREDDTVWHEVVHGMALWEEGKAMDRIINNCPENFNDHSFMQEFFAHEGRQDYLGYPFLDVKEAAPADVPGFSGRGMSYKKFVLPGIECRLKYPRWQLGGVKEIWEFVLGKGVKFEWGRPYGSHELFAVREGSVSVGVQGYGEMTAKPGDIIRIPDFTEHSITALERGTVLQDFNVQFDLLMLLDEIETARGKLHGNLNISFYEEILSRFGCPLTSLSIDGEKRYI